MTLREMIGKLFIGLVFINVFLVIGSFRARSLGDDSLDWQVVMKLSFWLICFCVSLFFWRSWIMRVVRYDNIMMAFLFVFLTVSCLYAPSIPFSLGALFSIIAVKFLFYASDAFVEDEEIIQSIYYALALVFVTSIIVYFVNPELGRMGEWVDGKQLPGKRMSGITGTPNAMGGACTFAMMIAIYYRKSLCKKNALAYWAILFLSVLCLLMSNSRSSMAAFVFALCVVYFAQVTKEKILLFCVGILVLAAFLYAIDIESLMVMISRSGDAEEIMTGTGRTHIWEAVIRLVSERPLTGYGFGSSSFILPKMEDEIGHAPPHAHNMVLQILFSIGYVGVAVFLLMYAIKIYYMLQHADYFKVMLLAYLLINGVTEAVLFKGTVNMPHIMLAVVFCLEYRRKSDQ